MNKNGVVKHYYLPEIGDGDAYAEVISIQCTVGSKFRAGDELLILTTDKASFSLEATEDGVITEIFAMQGQKLKNGEKLVSYLSTKES